MKKILHFTKGDIQIAGGYFNTKRCLACAAIRRTFKLPAKAVVKASGHAVGFQIPGESPKTFAFCDDGAEKISACYGWRSTKPNQNTKPFQVVIRPIRPSKFAISGWDNF